VIKYPIDYNPIVEYYEQIKTGAIITSKKVERIYKKLVDDVYNDKSEYEYSPQRANHAIEFIENFCKHSKGKWGGQPIELELWQKAFIAASFGFIHALDGTRKYREILLVVARKNGKSTIASGIGLYLQIADGEPGAEIYAVATKKDQAKLVWTDAKRMVNKSPALRKRIKPLVSELRADFNDSTFKPLGSDSETLDGLNVHGAMMDEIHAWKDKNLYDVIVDGTSSREQSMIFMITTAGTIREAVYDMKYEEAEMLLNGLDDPDGYKDDRFLPIVYELDNRNEWLLPECWMKANPGLGTIKKVDQLETKVNKAKANSMLVKNLLTKDFNVRETSTESWLTFEEANNTDTFDLGELKPRYAIGGADLSETVDLTAACIMFMLPNDNKIYVKHMYWLPEDLLEKRSNEDKIPYDLWHDKGLLRTTPGNKVHHKYVTEWFVEMMNEYDIYIPWVGYDRWSATYWVEEMQDTFGKDVMVPIAQGKQTLSSPMKLLKAELEKKNVVYDNNPITKWCLMNTSIHQDDKNNTIQPVKGSNQRKRIDGLAAMLDAYVVLNDKQVEYLNII